MSSQLADRRLGQLFEALLAQHRVRDGGADAGRAVRLEDVGRGDEGAAGRRHVVDHDDVLALDVADEVEGLDVGAGAALLGHEADAGAEALGVPVGGLDAPGVRRDDDRVGEVEAAQVLDEDRRGVEMVDGDVEVALDLRGVEVEAEDAVGAGGLDELRDERGRNRDAGLVLAVLAGVAVVRQDGGDPLGGGAADGVDHDEELHVGLVRRLAGRLDDEDIASADALVDLDELLAVWELQDVDAV